MCPSGLKATAVTAAECVPSGSPSARMSPEPVPARDRSDTHGRPRRPGRLLAGERDRFLPGLFGRPVTSDAARSARRSAARRTTSLPEQRHLGAQANRLTP
ncbi:hypothetical protein GCM10010294_67050 [Streptomyces griseoloalbus]|nr:hypothetical protein GCM10010294_67050 [Streptomyces griseoloalbus]